MALFDDNVEERTESPSQFRREEFRKSGGVALSRELLSVSILLATGMTFYVAGSVYQKEFGLLADQFFHVQRDGVFDRQTLMDMRYSVIKHWGLMVLPVFAVAAFTGILVSIAQVGVYFSWEPLAMDWSRLSPASGMKRIFSMRGGVEAIKALFKMAVVGTVVYFFLKKQSLQAGHLLSMDVAESFPYLLMNTGKLCLFLLLSLAVISALDYGFQRWQLEKQMMMTRSEAREEFKLREGDPLIKSRIKQIQRRMARRRMMEDVPKADVVVTNPTHFAVALKYDDKTMAAPKVIAKGAGAIAQKIKEMARFHHIPVVENKPLARTLFKSIEIGGSIPRELYKAVAEVLAYVYRLKGRVMYG